MLQRFEITRHYSQPLSPIPASGERYAVPPDFVDGLAFLRPLLNRRGWPFEWRVLVSGGEQYVLTNGLVVEYQTGNLDLHDWWFGPDVIGMLEAFDAPPSEVIQNFGDLCFRWHDGQEFLVHERNQILPGSAHRRMADEAFSHFQPFDHGIKITDESRRDLRKLIGHKKLAADIFIDGQSVVSRMSSDGKNWTFESSDPFLTNAARIMRFDRQAFLNMIRVANDIDFSVSPVCFRHAHGRGMLIERTATSDTPDFEVFND